MKVRTVDGTDAAGLELALDVLRHAEAVPEGPWTVQLGMAAVADATGAVWFVEDGQVSRLVHLPCPCGHAELTTFRDGVEVYRSTARTS